MLNASVTILKGNWAPGARRYKGSPNDVTAPPDTLNRMEEMAGRCQEDVYCDKGYRSKKLHENLQYKVFIPGAKLQATAAQNKRFKRRKVTESWNEINGLGGILRLQPEQAAEIVRGFLSQLPTSLILGVQINSWAVLMWHGEICLFS